MIGPILNLCLQEFESVSVPNLGTFSRTHKPSLLNFADKTIWPASAQVEFSVAKVENVERLIDKLKGISRLDSDQVTELVAGFANSANEAIRTNGIFDIDGFGTLKTNIEGEIGFIQHNHVVYHADSFGLQPLPANLISSQFRAELESRDIPVIPLHPFDEEIRTARKITEKSSKTWVPYAAVIGAMIASFSAVMYLASTRGVDLIKTNGQQTSMQEAGILPLVSHPLDSLNDRAINDSLQADIVVDPVKPSNPDRSAQISATNSTFYIVAGSFKNTSRLSGLEMVLKSKGYETRVIPENELGMTRISIARFQDKAQALAYLRKEQGSFTERLWILKDDHK